ncbi:MAG: hypothetical protein GC185_07870 [Alphaproteobacteria bacterium]|nr:hypothetical protein [Alphaproteobacteria bacterium]
MKPHDVSSIFNKFAGREVPMTETERKMTIGGKEYSFNEVRPADQNDPVLGEMRDEAKKHGLSLRVWWEGIMGTMDYRTDRVNAHIEKGNDGKWRVGQRFNIG